MASRPRHFAVDGRELIGRPTGVGVYVREVLRSWAGAGLPHRFTVIAHGPPPASLADLRERVQWHVQPARRSGTVWEQTRLPRALAAIRPDAFFAPAYTAPLRVSCPTVVVVHDGSFFAHPEWFRRREGWRRRWLTRATARRAFRVFTVSEAARTGLVPHLGIPSSRIALAPPGAPSPASENPGPRDPLVLYVGSLFNRRRIPDLIAAFARVAARLPDARLVLAGDNRTAPRLDPRALAAEAGVAGRVEYLEYVDDAAREALYRRARVFAFLSDYEGFGIPPLEALAQGVAPVVLDTPVSREVYGEAALRVPPALDAIADALARLLTDDDLHGRLLAAGRERLAAYSWARTARTILDALEEAAGA